MATREEIIRQIVERDLSGASLSKTQVQAENPRLYKAACDKFADWETALKYAGISRSRIASTIGITPDRVLKGIRKLCASGCSISESRISRRDQRFYDAAVHYFGTWRNALAAGGVNIQNVRELSNATKFRDQEAIGAAIRKRHESGLSMRFVEVCLDNYELARAARSRFGSWRQALAGAGLVPRVHTNGDKWSKAKVVAAIRQRWQTGKRCTNTATRADDSALVAAARYHFGSWRAALEAAGVNHDA